MAKGVARKGFDLDLADGQAAEGKLGAILAETGSLVEVKSDKKARLTGNVYVEVEYRGQPSGITSTEAEWWAIEVDDDVFVLMKTSILRDIVSKRRRMPGGDFNRSMGVLVPLERLIKKNVA